MSRIQTPFGFQSTAEEVIRGIELGGKRVLITGGASGIGTETSRALASVGAEVIMAVRRVDAGEKVAAEIGAATGNPNVTVRHLDLADQESVKAFVAGWSGPLDVLINNAAGRLGDAVRDELPRPLHTSCLKVRLGSRGALAVTLARAAPFQRPG